MIIEFKVKNFRSIKDLQTFSFVAGPANELKQNTFPAGAHLDLDLVRAAVIYGANAGGKSNILSALLFMRMFVIASAKESIQGEKIRIERFSFDETSRLKPAEFEVTFIKNDIRYQYGFSLDENRILEEWLFAYPSGRAQQWFSRVFNNKNQEYSWKFSNFFKGNKHQVVELTRPDVLFLSNAVKLNNEQLVPVFEWFQKDLLLIDSSQGIGIGYTKSIEYLKSKDGKIKILEFLRIADPSIANIKLDFEKISVTDLPNFPNSMPKEVQDFFKKEMLRRESPKIFFLHENNASLRLNEESDGTLKLLAFAGKWLEALDNGRVLIIDELDNSLHPLVVRFLIQLVCNPQTNKKNAQLIFTTHDTSLLDNEIFRRDQIWFVEKDKANSTQLYPLLDFSPRKHEAIGKGYLQGRYGALPYIGDWRF